MISDKSIALSEDIMLCLDIPIFEPNSTIVSPIPLKLSRIAAAASGNLSPIAEVIVLSLVLVPPPIPKKPELVFVVLVVS